ncbi:hypothetical protein V6N12_056789 [Hibiscus sabdariffa]|uniref:Uncharacterized protein n=1 Tax=Hibiscus sabdariffa TaxID=183260 RepID=A0ABR2DC31_9ROSI
MASSSGGSRLRKMPNKDWFSHALAELEVKPKFSFHETIIADTQRAYLSRLHHGAFQVGTLQYKMVLDKKKIAENENGLPIISWQYIFDQSLLVLRTFV